jgi:peptidylprolyl isomerase
VRVRVVLVMVLALALAGCPDSSSKPATTTATTKGEGPPPTSEPAVKTASGLVYHKLHVGTGHAAEKGRTVVVHYHGWLADGTTFDASRPRGEPFEFVLGRGEVIKGWDEGVAGMKVGGARRLIVPPDLGYGDQAMGKIPPGSTLTFDVELLGVK